MFTRRTLLKTGAAVAASSLAMPAFAQGTKIKIGYVSPQSGPLSAFSEADNYMVAKFLESAKAAGLDVEVIVKDTEGKPDRLVLRHLIHTGYNLR